MKLGMQHLEPHLVLLITFTIPVYADTEQSNISSRYHYDDINRFFPHMIASGNSAISPRSSPTWMKVRAA
jgi:hypothetical protein